MLSLSFLALRVDLEECPGVVVPVLCGTHGSHPHDLRLSYPLGVSQYATVAIIFHIVVGKLALYQSANFFQIRRKSVLFNI